MVSRVLYPLAPPAEAIDSLDFTRRAGAAPVAHLDALLVGHRRAVQPPLVARQRQPAALDPVLLRLGSAGRGLDGRRAAALARLPAPLASAGGGRCRRRPGPGPVSAP